jgi:hypothetical protein
MKERVMSVRIRRVVVAGAVAAAAVAIPVAALASRSPSGKPAPSPSAASNSATAASKSAAAASEPRVDRSLAGPVAVAALAGRIGVSHGAAQRALAQIGALGGQDGVDPTDPAFAAIARGLGVSPAQLAAALVGVKQAAAGK